MRMTAVVLMLGLLTAAGCRETDDSHRRSQYLMGTVVTITVAGLDRDDADRAMNAAFEEIRRLEGILTFFSEDSDLGRINAAAGERPVGVSAETIEVLAEARRISDRSGGAFDATIGPLVSLWGFEVKERFVPPKEEIERARTLVNWRNMAVDPELGTVRLERRGMKVDLGGIAKGYAADRAAETLRKHGVSRALVAVAGDIRAVGEKAVGVAWHVGIQHPREPGAVLGSLKIADRSVSTSGDYERYFIKDDVRYHHILDPATGRPAAASRSATVLAPTTTLSDALSTAAFVLGPEKGIALVRSVPGAEAIIVDREGRVHVTPGLAGKVEGLAS
ncbi:MAG: hypothetical protein A2V83_03810 [Nitrospirae bacterium RBG_16_64_22]|nr:MAG: hypothetical protein A2V83_03810 [Nitrospirae bacterium RBG_16_64_22]